MSSVRKSNERFEYESNSFREEKIKRKKRNEKNKKWKIVMVHFQILLNKFVLIECYGAVNDSTKMMRCWMSSIQWI